MRRIPTSDAVGRVGLSAANGLGRCLELPGSDGHVTLDFLKVVIGRQRSSPVVIFAGSGSSLVVIVALEKSS